ncbi:MAG: PadR family transcriptional regulator [Verrucomicrobiota bacterium]
MRTISERGTLWELAVLSLVREEPMHPYQMLQWLRERHKDDVLDLKRGSLYHAIDRLCRQGLIEPAGTGRDGRRPERTVYRLTPEGRRRFLERLRTWIAVPRRAPSEFMGSLSFLVHLAPADAAARLEARAAAVERESAALAAGLEQAREFVDPINLIESDYQLAMLQSELLWIRGALRTMRSGRLNWNFQKIIRQARARRHRPKLNPHP